MRHIFKYCLLSSISIFILINCGKLPDSKLMEMGKKMEEQERYEDAIAKYEKILDIHSQSPYCAEAEYRAGNVYANGIKNYEKAVERFTNVVEKYPKSKYASQSQFMIGFIFANDAPDSLKAREAYAKFLSSYPDHELIPSVQWELKYLGKDINAIPELMSLEVDESQAGDQ